MFTCRVCMKSFHEECLQKLGELSTEVGKLHAKLISKSTIGWSCYKCVSKAIEAFSVHIDSLECTQTHVHVRTNVPTHTHTRTARQPFGWGGVYG